MMVSTKGRYALRVMIELAQQQRSVYNPVISLGAIARRQGISLKYLESIAALLNKGGLVVSTRGKDGGYRLACPAAEIPVGKILRLTEGSLAPVACLETGCDRADGCLTLPLWQQLDALIDGYLARVSLEDLLCGRVDAPAAGGGDENTDEIGKK